MSGPRFVREIRIAAEEEERESYLVGRMPPEDRSTGLGNASPTRTGAAIAARDARTRWGDVPHN